MEKDDLIFIAALFLLMTLAFVGCGREHVRYCVNYQAPGQNCCTTNLGSRLEGCDNGKIIYNPTNVIEIRD